MDGRAQNPSATLLGENVAREKTTYLKSACSPEQVAGALAAVHPYQPSMSVNLKQIRERIDSLDRQIQALITARAHCAQEVAHAKGKAPDATFYRPEREAEVLRNAIARNEGPLRDEDLACIFREIMSACLALQRPMRIAYLGPAGTYTQAAAYKHFGHAVQTISHSAIDEIFRDVESGASHFGVVPVENSTEGVVTHTLDKIGRAHV